MNKEQYEEIIGSLVEFVKRVSSGENATSEEVKVLPEVAKVLLDMNRAVSN